MARAIDIDTVTELSILKTLVAITAKQTLLATIWHTRLDIAELLPQTNGQRRRAGAIHRRAKIERTNHIVQIIYQA